MLELTDFEIIYCCQCDIAFAMRQEFIEKKKKNHSGFFCPNGHNVVYPAPKEEVDVDKLKEELERLKADNTELRKLFAEDKDTNILKKLKIQ